MIVTITYKRADQISPDYDMHIYTAVIKVEPINTLQEVFDKITQEYFINQNKVNVELHFEKN